MPAPCAATSAIGVPFRFFISDDVKTTVASCIGFPAIVPSCPVELLITTFKGFEIATLLTPAINAVVCAFPIRVTFDSPAVPATLPKRRFPASVVL